MRTSLDVIMDVEAELALHKTADLSISLLRGCQLCLLTLPPPKPTSTTQPLDTGNLFQSTLDFVWAAAATQRALQECQVKRAALQVCG